jgi:hypothetical protein
MRVRGSRGVRVRHIEVSGGKKLLQLKVAIRDIPMEESCGPQREIVEDRCQEVPGSRGSGNQGFQGHRTLASGNRNPRFPDMVRSHWSSGFEGLLHVSKDLKESGFGISGFLHTKELLHWKSAISRYLIERRGSGDVEERAHTCIGDRHFRILGDEKITPGEVTKTRIPT